MTKQVLKTRMIGDSEMIISVVLLKRTEKSAFIMIDKGEIVRCKIHKFGDNKEFVMPYGRYSMAPSFFLN